jgi:hypothetical protein
MVFLQFYRAANLQHSHALDNWGYLFKTFGLDVFADVATKGFSICSTI